MQGRLLFDRRESALIRLISAAAKSVMYKTTIRSILKYSFKIRLEGQSAILLREVQSLRSNPI